MIVIHSEDQRVKIAHIQAEPFNNHHCKLSIGNVFYLYLQTILEDLAADDPGISQIDGRVLLLTTAMLSATPINGPRLIVVFAWIVIA